MTTTPRPHPHDSAPTRRSLLAPLALLLVVWAMGSLFLGADLGRNSDDYCLNLRDPGTGELPPLSDMLVPYPYFWRPLHLALVFGLATLLPSSFQALHGLSALLHLAACLGVWTMLRRTCTSSAAPLAGAMVWMSLAWHAESVFWFSTICTPIATALFMGAALMVLRIGRAPAGRSRPSLTWLWALTIVIGCFFEPPLAATAGLPLLCWIAARKGPAPGAALRRSIGVTIACGLGGVVVVGLVLLTAPGHVRGGSESFVSPGALGPRAAEFSTRLADALWGYRGSQMFSGAFEQGLGAVTSPTGLVGATLLLAALGTALRWVWRSCGTLPSARTGTTDGESSPIAGSRPAFIAWALLSAALSLLPAMLVVGQLVQDRLLYLPLLLVVMAIAWSVDFVLTRLGVRGFMGRAGSMLIVAGATAASSIGVVALIGHQVSFQNRSRQDERSAEQIRELLPRPDGRSVFIPMRLDHVAARTRSDLFNTLPPSVLETRWSATMLLHSTYARNDLTALRSTRWTEPPFVNATPIGPMLTSPLRSEFTPDSSAARLDGRLTWSRLIPLVADADGRVLLVRRLLVEQPSGDDLSIAIPQVETRLQEQPDLRSRTLIVRTWDDNPTPAARPLAWHWSSAAPVDVYWAYLWGGQRVCTWMHGSIGHTRAEMRAILEPSPVPRRAVIRITIAPADLDRFPLAGPVNVSLLLEAGATNSTLATVTITPRLIRARQGWVKLEATVPADTTTSTLRLLAAPDPAGAAPPPIHVTPGFLVTPEPSR